MREATGPGTRENVEKGVHSVRGEYSITQSKHTTNGRPPSALTSVTDREKKTTGTRTPRPGMTKNLSHSLEWPARRQTAAFNCCLYALSLRPMSFFRHLTTSSACFLRLSADTQVTCFAQACLEGKRSMMCSTRSHWQHDINKDNDRQVSPSNTAIRVAIKPAHV